MKLLLAREGLKGTLPVDSVLRMLIARHNAVQCLMGTCFIIDGAAIGVTKRRHDVTFPLLT
jgi:hypothetical protein